MEELFESFATAINKAFDEKCNFTVIHIMQVAKLAFGSALLTLRVGIIPYRELEKTCFSYGWIFLALNVDGMKFRVKKRSLLV